MKKINFKKVIPIVLCIIIACISMTKLTPVFTETETYQGTIQSLDEKKKNVLALTATTTAIAAAISLLPGDAGTPIADKATKISGYLLIVLCAIFFEKFILTILGGVTFFVLIPLICALIICFYLTTQKQFIVIAIKASIFALAISTSIPLSIKISDMIEETHQTSIEDTIKSSNKAADEIKSKSDEDEPFFKSFFKKFKNGVKGVLNNFEKKINQLVEAVAVMIVTTCLIPIAVILFFIWLCKMIMGINIVLPSENKKIIQKPKIIETKQNIE